MAERGTLRPEWCVLCNGYGQVFLRRLLRSFLVLAVLTAADRVRAGSPPAWLPRYDVTIELDTDNHQAHVVQRATWTNHVSRPVKELVFNAHSRYVVPDGEVGFMAKMLEILRVQPGEALGEKEPACDIQHVGIVPDVVQAGGKVGGKPPAPAPVEFRYEGDTKTALVVPLAQPLKPGESVTVQLDFTMRLPQKQGRWGQWRDVTFLSNWLPVFAVCEGPPGETTSDDAIGADGWRPTPFIPWHQPYYNEAGNYTVHAVVPAAQEVACSGMVVKEEHLPDGRRQLEIEANGMRDFALLCSARYQCFEGEVTLGPEGSKPVRIRVLAFPEHEHYARKMVQIAAESLSVYSRWFGQYPYPQFTIAESFFGWNGNECSTLVMIDDRVFGMPHLAGGFVEYLVSHEICHQWWYNLVGTNGYSETFMDEALATYFSHRWLNQKIGKNNNMMTFPKALEWLPNIRREDYRTYAMFGAIGRGDNGPCVQDMPKFEHLVNLLSMCYDKGSRIVGMIEERLGEAAFMDFMRRLHSRYQYRILRVADFQRELEAYTGQSWDAFFKDWLYGKGITDWAVDKVKVEAPPQCRDQWLRRKVPWRRRRRKAEPICDGNCRPTWRAIVWLKQKGECTEQTCLGFALPGCPGYSIRVPVMPNAGSYQLDNPPTQVTVEGDCLRVEVLLPAEPTQIAVDPDQVLVDRDPANNYWKAEFRWRFTPLYTFLEETDLTNSYDRWNLLFGPWIYASAYDNPWYPLSTMVGVRAGAYRTQQFSGGMYAAYRTDFRDVVAGVDGLWDHWPFDHFQVGVNAERRLASLYDSNQDAMRAAAFGRYIFQYGDSLYLPPMQYLEGYTDYQDNFLPYYRAAKIDPSERPQRYAAIGMHYRMDYRTPYWDPEGGFLFDFLYEGGIAELERRQGMQRFATELAAVKYLPDLSEIIEPLPHLHEALRPLLRWLAETRLAVHGYGAMGFPSRGEWFTLGGQRLIRGFDLAERQGSALWVASAEWRVPIAKQLTWDALDHCVGLRNAYAAAFYDVGDIYTSGHQTGPIAHSVGGGLRLDVTWLSVVERTMLRFDVAKVVNDTTPVQFWFGIQHPF